MSGAHDLLLEFVLVMFVSLLILFVFQRIKQPSVVAYIIAGIIAGPFGLSIISDAHLIEILGEFGVLMLLFFIGMEVSISSLVKNWRVVILGSLFQVCGSVLVMALLGHFFDWDISRIVLLGFVTSLSSTAVVLSYLESKNMISSGVGKDVVGVLLAQDILVAPMLIVISALSGTFNPGVLILQIVGAVLLGVALYFILKKKTILSPTLLKGNIPGNDHKLFIALILCFGAALLTSAFHLPLGLGAFIGGVLAANIKNLDWVRQELHSFKTLFIALFFVSIGLLIDVDFLIENILFVGLILMSVFTINTFVNASVFLWLKRPLAKSLYSGAMLAPIGEFSFLLAAAGLQLGAIEFYAYQITVIVIALSLILGPFWTRLFQPKTPVS